jgi:hypothetical protein
MYQAELRILSRRGARSGVTVCHPTPFRVAGSRLPLGHRGIGGSGCAAGSGRDPATHHRRRFQTGLVALWRGAVRCAAHMCSPRARHVSGHSPHRDAGRSYPRPGPLRGPWVAASAHSGGSGNP